MNESRRRVLKALVGGLGAAYGMSVLSRAEAAPDRVRTAFVLFPTSAALDMKLTGLAKTDTRQKSGREKLNIQIESGALAAGTQLDVYAINPVNSPDPVFVGTVTLSVNPKRRKTVIGKLELKNFNGGTLPDGLSIVGQISEFRVTEHNNAQNVLMSSKTAGGGGGGGGEEPSPDRRDLTLSPTPYGVSTGTTGTAFTQIGEDNQRFGVEVISTGLPPNTVVEVRFDHADHGSDYFAGLFILLPSGTKRRAKVVWDTVEGPFPPAGSTPVSKITAVRVFRQSDGQLLLTGTF